MLTSDRIAGLLALVLLTGLGFSLVPQAPQIKAQQQTNGALKTEANPQQETKPSTPPPSIVQPDKPRDAEQKIRADTPHRDEEGAEFAVLRGFKFRITDGLLVVFTFLLFLATGALGWLAWRQARLSKILQRAYVSVNPGGVEAFIKGPYYSCTVIFENVGNLPARNARWFIDRMFSAKGSLKDFPIKEERFEGKNVIPPGTEMRMGSKAIEAASYKAAILRPTNNWLYVWGEIRYDDGFGGNERSTKFCHRYNIAAARPESAYWIKAKSARYHIHGNEAD